jgi:hypothetical protein
VAAPLGQPMAEDQTVVCQAEKVWEQHFRLPIAIQYTLTPLGVL